MTPSTHDLVRRARQASRLMHERPMRSDLATALQYIRVLADRAEALQRVLDTLEIVYDEG